MTQGVITRPNTLHNPKLIAHRGYTPAAPENSLPAFEAAGRAGFWAIETDVHKSLDGVLVCSHDAAVDRMYDGCGLIARMTCDELMRLRLTAGHGLEDYPKEALRMPTFEEYLALCKQYGAVPFIETKTEDIAAVLEEACRYFEEKDVVISSFCEAHLLMARRISQKVFLHHIFTTPDTMRRLGRLGYCGVSYNYPVYKEFPQELLLQAHSEGVLLCLRAGDTPQAVRDMVEMGLDYIPTNCMTNACVI